MGPAAPRRTRSPNRTDSSVEPTRSVNSTVDVPRAMPHPVARSPKLPPETTPGRTRRCPATRAGHRDVGSGAGGQPDPTKACITTPPGSQTSIRNFFREIPSNPAQTGKVPVSRASEGVVAGHVDPRSVPAGAPGAGSQPGADAPAGPRPPAPSGGGDMTDPSFTSEADRDLLVVLPSREEAEQAAQALLRAGIPASDVRVDAEPDRIASLRAEMHEELCEAYVVPNAGVALPEGGGPRPRARRPHRRRRSASWPRSPGVDPDRRHLVPDPAADLRPRRRGVRPGHRHGRRSRRHLAPPGPPTRDRARDAAPRQPRQRRAPSAAGRPAPDPHGRDPPRGRPADRHRGHRGLRERAADRGRCGGERAAGRRLPPADRRRPTRTRPRRRRPGRAGASGRRTTPARRPCPGRRARRSRRPATRPARR